MFAQTERRKQLKTFAEILTETTAQALYPEHIDEATRQTIFEWFQFRVVCDDQKFPVFFRRVLVRDYPRYLELLRIQPDPAKYDWFVENYLERQLLVSTEKGETASKTGSATASSNETGSGTTTNSGSDTDKQEFSGADTVASDGSVSGNVGVKHGGTEVTTHGGTDTVTKNGTKSGSDTVENTGTVTTADSGTDTHTIQESSNTLYGGQDTTAKNGTSSVVKTGSETDNTTRSQENSAIVQTEVQNNQIQSVERSGKPSSSSTTETGNTEATKAGPMDASVVTSTAPSSCASGGVGALSVGFDGHATQISQGYNRSDTSTESVIDETTETSYSGKADTTKVTTEPWEQKENTTKTYTNVTDTGSTSDTETTTYGKSDTTAGTKTDAMAHGKTEIRTDDLTQETKTSETTNESTGTQYGHTESLSDTRTEDTTSEEISTDTTTSTYGKVVTNTHTAGTSARTATEATSTTESLESESAEKNTTGNSDTRERLTGRYKEPAEILRAAIEVIEASNAWMWLYGELNTCFLSVYEV